MGKGVRPFERIASLGVLSDPIQSIIHAIKYRKRWPLAEWLAEIAAEQPTVKRVLADADMLLPVALFPARQVERGYNQSEVIARRLGARSGLPAVSAVERVRDTSPQAHLKARQSRYENLRGAFVVTRPELIRGKHLVVVDDVMTTSATLSVFGRALLTAHPASLSAIVLAVADPKGRQFEII